MRSELLYHRPVYTTTSSNLNTPSIGSRTSGSELSPSVANHSNGIPDMLSFDRIIAGGTCPPCTLQDFMDYLKYIEHAAEHLQFFLWFRGYLERFEKLNCHEKALSPEWTESNQRDAVEEWRKAQADTRKRQSANVVTEILNGTIFGNKSASIPVVGMNNPFNTPPSSSHGRSSSHNNDGLYPKESGAGMQKGKVSSPWESSGDFQERFPRSEDAVTSVASEVFKNAGLSRPFTIQPFRREIEHVLQTYLADGSPRELNISAVQRKTLLKALETTTHPTAFRDVATEIEMVLRTQLHPNFIRWAICNGNRPRVIFARGLGIFLIVVGMLVELLITLSSVGRGWRVLGALGLVLGMSTLFAAYKGMCVVLHGLHHRHLRPWELFVDAENSKSDDSHAYNMRESVDTVQSSNSYEDSPWVVKYQKRNIVRKIFDREVWIQEPALRQIQDIIFLQSILFSLLGASIVTAVFVAVPKGGYI